MPPKPKLANHRLKFGEFELSVLDFVSSITPRVVRKEILKDSYNIEAIGFLQGDTIIDIGAHIGIVSIYIAKRFPFVTVHAFEPIPDNFQHLVGNIRMNNVMNVIPHNLAITKDGRDLDMIVNFNNNSGGGTGQLSNMRLSDHHCYTVRSVTLDSVFEDLGINSCRLLKIDCEGMEHEILLNARYLDRVSYLSGEFHMNQHLRRQGYSLSALINHCHSVIDPERVKISTTRMAE